MIVAVEGPDRAGKTTLLRPLAEALGAKLITRLPTTVESVKAWPYVEPVYLHLLEQLTEPGRTYVTDRSMTVSAQVYSAVFGRPLLFDPAPWYAREFVVYVDTPLEVLKARHRATEGEGAVFPEEMYGRTLEEYAKVLPRYRGVRVDGEAPVGQAVWRVLEALGRA